MRIWILILLCLSNVNSYSQVRVIYSPTIIEQNGKFGVIDQNGKTVLPPECDTIISSHPDYKKLELLSAHPLFILKKGKKYGYAYRVSLDSTGAWLKDENKIHWEISEFIYDDIQYYSFGSEEYQYKNSLGSGSKPYLVLKYQQKAKWGLIYIRAQYSTGIYSYSSGSVPDGFGVLRMTEAIYDFVGNFNEGIYDVKLDNKYGFLQVINNDKWIDTTFNQWFDSIPCLLYKSYKNPIPFIRQVRKNGKYGIVQINPEKNEIEYLVGCECVHQLKNESDKLLICDKTEQDKVAVFDIANNKKFEMAALNKPLYEYNIISIDTVPNNKLEAHKTYLMLGFGTKDTDNYYYNKGSELYFIDLGIQKLETIYNDTSVNYACFDGNHGVLITKKINTQKGFVYEFIDLETGKIAFSLPPEKKEYAYNIMTRYNKEYSCDYLNIGSRYYIEPKYGGAKYGYIGCYNFRAKKYKKGKCPACY